MPMLGRRAPHGEVGARPAMLQPCSRLVHRIKRGCVAMRTPQLPPAAPALLTPHLPVPAAVGPTAVLVMPPVRWVIPRHQQQALLAAHVAAAAW